MSLREMVSPISSPTNSVASDEAMLPRDVEGGIAHKQRSSITHLRYLKLPFAIGKRPIVPNLLGIIALVMTVLCVAELYYIWYLRGGLVHIPNDRYDNLFGVALRALDRNSPGIWDQDRQDFIHNAVPVAVHSHNDYSRDIPLFEALASGCISVEADIHLSNGDLLVGHSNFGLRQENTLRSMYLEPLERMLDAQNGNRKNGDDWMGMFNKSPKQTVVLLVDQKTAGAETFDELARQLRPLRQRDYLSYWNGSTRIMRPLTVVASGDAPFDSILNISNTHRDIFWDAKLERLTSVHDDFDVEPIAYGYNASNSYFASTRWRNARLWSAAGNESESQLPSTPLMRDIEANHIEQAKARNLISRFWDTPSGPPNLQEIAWRVQRERQVGILNMDDMSVVRERAYGWGLAASTELR